MRCDPLSARFGDVVRRGSEIDTGGRVRPARHRELALRVGTSADPTTKKAPIFVLLHVLHRAAGREIGDKHAPRLLPDDAKVSWILVRRWTEGTRVRWSLSVVYRPARDQRPPVSEGRARSVGVDIGWRAVPGGVRVAHWWGSDGRAGELVLPDRVAHADRHADELRAVRDRQVNDLRVRLVAWFSAYRMDLAEHYRWPLTEPDAWVVQETVAIHAWRRIGRFVRLTGWWAAHRLAGDDDVFAAAVTWRAQDAVAWDAESAIRARRPRQILGRAQQLAAYLGQHYERVGLERPFVAEVVRRKAGEPDDPLRRIAGERVPHVAPAALPVAIRAAQHRWRFAAVDVDPANTTRTCSSCGHVRAGEDYADLVVTCAACGYAEDQDLTAGKHLAAAASAAMLDDDGKPLAMGKSLMGKKKPRVRRTRRAVRGDGTVDRSQTSG